MRCCGICRAAGGMVHRRMLWVRAVTKCQLDDASVTTCAQFSFLSTREIRDEGKSAITPVLNESGHEGGLNRWR